MAQNKGSDKSPAEKRKGGLGRGLAALIPSGPTDSPGLGGGAADIILGGAVGERARRRPDAAPRPGLPPIPKPDTPARPEGGAPKPGPVRTPEQQGHTPSPTPAPQPTAPVAAEGAEDASISEFGASYQEIPIDSIVPNPHQPRSVFDTEALDELVHSIREFGLMQPIVVRPSGDGFELIMGERRLRASRRAGLEFIPAIVRETDDSAMLRDALLENIHRVQLNPLEEAAAYQQLLEEFGVTQAELADKLGRSRPVITNMIRLLNLPVNVQTKVAAGVLSAGHARAILGLKGGEEAQDALASRIIAEGLSVRATEELVLLSNRGEDEEKKPPREKAPTPEVFTRAAEYLADNLDTKVSVTMGKRKGRLVVEFGDQDDFERIMGLIQGQKDS
ncbi:ParB/RepB/Spo0J family partition protein [Corynebacterium efficiens]|uniref:Putative chromosome partitioning protein ParB n=2 Tax=Corynebacterium efficiens TaxID=152794 RepID=Q8FSV3_COREF|nr:ParB/RepB/Spo0J family partition protein [Corynebacterium efficiens]BAC19751.1 putative chromosome partitioning protein ParB [Corynebacterium efficiens YS-314]